MYLYVLPAGPSGVHGPGSARALPRVVGGRRRAKRQEKGMGEVGTGMGGMGKGGWERGMGTWMGGMGKGKGGEGWRSEVRVEPAACRQGRTITQARPPPLQPPPERRRMLRHLRDIVP